MNTTLFEIGRMDVIDTPVIIFSIIAVIELIFFIFTRRGGLVEIFTFGLIELVLLIIIFSSIYTAVDYNKCVYEEYMNNNAKIVTGIVHDYEVDNEAFGPDRFMVLNQDFVLEGGTNGSYYKQSEGGIIKNGTRLKIWYIPYKYENYIARIDYIP